MTRLVLLALAVGAVVAAPAGAVRSTACPRGLLPFEANSISGAAAAGLARENRSSKPLVVSAVLATVDQDRGMIAKRECGPRVWQRTIVVYIRLRAFLPSASLSSRVSFVGRFKGGYRVWQIAH